MIPKRLVLQGIYSYQTRQEIDFSNLISAGIFGIFGAVGSGKSTILEAISFALYNQTERLSTRDNRNFNMMNLASDNLYVEFEFSVRGQDYLVKVEGRRNSKQYQKVGSFNRVLYKRNSEGWLPLEVDDASDIVGMSYENFRRTIIIPQGKFQEFLQLTDRDRTRMLKEIFALEKYELFYKVTSLESRNNQQLLALRSRIEQIGSVDESLVKELGDQLKALAKLLEEKSKALSQNEQLQKRLNEIINRRNLISKKLNEDKTSYQAVFEKLEHLIRETTQLQNDFLAIQKEYKDVDGLREKCEDLKFLIKAKRLAQDKEQVEQKLKAGDVSFKEEQDLLAKLKADYEKQKKELSARKESGISFETISAINAWLSDKSRYEKEIRRLREEVLASVEKEISSLTEERVGIDIKKMPLIKEQLDEVLLRERLSQYADNLEEGKPCPLCGSAHHPKVTHAGKDLSSLIRRLSDEHATLLKSEKRLNQISAVLEEKNKQKLVVQGEIESFEKKLVEHLASFEIEGIASHDEEVLNKMLMEYSASQEDITKRDQALDQLLAKIDTQSKLFDSIKAKKDALNNELTRLSAQVGTNLDNIKRVDAAVYSSVPLGEISREFNELDGRIKKTISQYETKQNILNQKNQDKSNLEGRVVTLKESISRGEDNLKEVSDELVVFLKKSNLSEGAEREIASTNELLRIEIRDITKRTGDVERQLTIYDKSLNDLKKFNSQIVELQKRAENIALLKKMFKGSGFVNYISTKYLHNMCEAANQRYHKLTKQQLKIEVDGNNNFKVRDYLNGGQLRSIKTLSGGQMFQASLCMALSLADSVKDLVGADQNFFFLDEGFGTLDSESLRLVFETLNSLRKDNRVVGVISHVEDLQAEVDVHLRICNEENSGSKVFQSWNL